MKKVSICLLALMLALAGCGQNEKPEVTAPTESIAPTENIQVKAKDTLQKVLNKEQSFIFKSLVFDKVTEENLERFTFATEGSAINPFAPWGYTYVDLDSDGIDELVIYPLSLTHCLILRYGGEKVYGYLVPQRTFVDLRTDGTFQTSSGAGINSISAISFRDISFEMEDIAYKDDMDGVYLLDGKASDKETVEAYFENWDATTTNVSWEKLD